MTNGASNVLLLSAQVDGDKELTIEKSDRVITSISSRQFVVTNSLLTDSSNLTEDLNWSCNTGLMTMILFYNSSGVGHFRDMSRKFVFIWRDTVTRKRFVKKSSFVFNYFFFLTSVRQELSFILRFCTHEERKF